MALFEDFLQVTIDGADVSDYVLSYQRNNSICEPGTSFVLGFTRKKPDDSVLDFDVSDPVILYEKYPSSDLVLKGYITSINANANNAELRVQGMDKYILLSDFFIANRLETAGESVAYWISYLCGLVNLDVQFDAYPGIPTAGADGNGGTPLGMQRAAESLAMLERKGAVYTRYDSDLDKIVVYTLSDAQPKVTIDSDNLVTFDQTEGTKLTRNVVKIYGGHDYDWLTQEAFAYNAVARTTISELVVDKTFVLASPEVRSQTFANIIASRILAITATLDDLVMAECAGLYPDVKITHNATINISHGETSYQADRMITSKGVSVNKGGGAKTVFTFGEKCPRITISPPPYFVYATYEGTESGAAISYDAGDSFYEFNQGLPASGIPAQSIAANAYNQLMMVTTSGIYRRYGVGDVWDRVTVLDDTYPSNDEGEVQFLPTDITFAKVEKEAGLINRFHMLGQVSGGSGGLPFGQERWWTYFTPDFGYTWSSMQLYTPGSGVGMDTISGLPVDLINGNGITPATLRGLALASGAIIWNVHAHDMEGDINGNVTVLVEGNPAAYAPEDTEAGDIFYIAYNYYGGAPAAWRFICGTWYMDNAEDWEGNPRANYTYGEEVGPYTSTSRTLCGSTNGPAGIFSIPNDRGVAYAISATHTPIGITVARTANEYFTTPSTKLDIPKWEWLESAGLLDNPVIDAFTVPSAGVLLDYSSLNSDDNVRFCVVFADLNTGGGGDDYPGNCYIDIYTYFFEDDVSAPASGIDTCNVTYDHRKIGVSSYAGSPLTYYGEGTYGWETQDPTTESPGPRSWQDVSPEPQGAQYSSVTTNLTETNYGYFAVAVQDKGSWHADSRDAGWPSTQHPRDWGEFGTVGIYVIKINLTDQEVDSISLGQYWPPDFHDPPPVASQPDRDDDIFEVGGDSWAYLQSLDCKMMQPDLLFFQEKWDGHGGVYGHYITYPGFARTQYSDWDTFWTQNGQQSIPMDSWGAVRKVPFYNENSIGYVSKGRELVAGSGYIGAGDSRVLYTDYSEGTVPFPPVMPSGKNSFHRGHPNNGIYITEERAIQPVPSRDPWDGWDYHFMHKAQRATPTTFSGIGNNSRFTDPYAQTNYNSGTYTMAFDFRTIVGTILHSGGGGSTNWNWMSG